MSDSMNITCPHCLVQNRLPLARISEHPKCGKCHQTLFNGKPVELNTASFERHLKNSDLPLLIDFWAPWCGPCKMMAPQFESAAKLLEPKVRLAKVNTEIEQTLAARFNIRSIPTIKLFSKGQEIASQAGAMDTQGIIQWARNYLS